MDNSPTHQLADRPTRRQLNRPKKPTRRNWNSHQNRCKIFLDTWTCLSGNLAKEKKTRDSLQVPLLSDGKLRRQSRKKYRELNGRLLTLWREYAAGERTTSSLLRAASRLQLPCQTCSNYKMLSTTELHNRHTQTVAYRCSMLQSDYSCQCTLLILYFLLHLTGWIT